jgi:hypothetical protein
MGSSRIFTHVKEVGLTPRLIVQLVADMMQTTHTGLPSLWPFLPMTRTFAR